MKLIVAIDDDNGISKNGEIPWKCPEDQKFFKLLTTGGIIVMGRKTADTLGRALPNRENLVMSRSPYNRQGFTRITEEDLFLNFNIWKEQDLWVIGGAEIYKHCLENGYVSTVYLNHISGTHGCDNHFFPFKYGGDPVFLSSYNLSDSCVVEKYKINY